MGFMIAGGIIALILLILLLWIRLSIVCGDEGEDLTVQILFFKIRIFGKEKKKPKKSKFKIRKFRKRTEKVLKKYRKSLKKSKKEPKKSSKAKSDKSRNIGDTVNKLISIFGDLLRKFPKYLRIDCLRLIIGVGGEDAASVAVNYGVTVQSVQYLATLLNGVTHFKAENGANISVYPEFASGKWSADIRLVFRLRIIHILKLGFILLKQYIKYKLKGKNEVKNKSPREDKAA